ncbi:MAG: uL15 family ribosomal protein [Nanoarchaeota archaeon]
MRSIKRRIDFKLRKKTNKELVRTIIKAKKNKELLQIAHFASFPRRKRIEVNLEVIEKKAKNGENIVVPGKVLSTGSITKKLNVYAVSFSNSAREKIENSGGKTGGLGEVEKIKQFTLLTE